MRSVGNNYNYFPENQLTKLAHSVQFFWELGGWPPGLFLATSLSTSS